MGGREDGHTGKILNIAPSGPHSEVCLLAS